MNVMKRHGSYWFIIFIDNYTRFDFAYLSSHMSETWIALDLFNSSFYWWICLKIWGISKQWNQAEMVKECKAYKRTHIGKCRPLRRQILPIHHMVNCDFL